MTTDPRDAALGRAQRAFLFGVVAVNLVVPGGIFIDGWPKPWRAFYGELSLINWFSSVQCALLGLLGFGVFLLVRLALARGGAATAGGWPWLLLATGFFFASVDEKLELHERLRDEFLEPRGVLTDVPGLKPADVVLPLYAVAGIVLTVLLLADLRRHRRALWVFLAGMALIVVTVAQDSLAWAWLTRPGIRSWQVIVEEVAETWAQGLFAIALGLVLFARLREVLAGGPGPAPRDDAGDHHAAATAERGARA